MPGYKTSATISRPLSEVFSYLTNVTTWPRWMQVEEAHPLGPGAVRVGMRAELVSSEGSRRVPFTIEITEFEPDRRIAFKTLSGPMTWIGSWEVRAIDARTTKVESIGSIQLHGLRRVLEPLMRGEMQRSEAAELVRLRTLLEGGEAR